MSPASSVLRTIKRRNLFRDVDRCLVAVSGGADSTATFRVLHELVSSGDLAIDLGIGHVVHDLRPGEGPEEDRRFVEALGNDREVPVHVRRVSVQKHLREETASPEAVARQKRYRALVSVCDQQEYDAVATGHHRDDRVETILLRMLRGTGVRGLAGMTYRDTVPLREMNGGMNGEAPLLLRPCLDQSRDDLVSFLEEREIPWRTDPTNRDPAHRRNRVRHLLLPYLRNRLDKDLDECLLRLSRRAGNVRDRIDWLWEERKPEFDVRDQEVVVEKGGVEKLIPVLYPKMLEAVRERFGLDPRVSFHDLDRLKERLRTGEVGRTETLSGGLRMDLEHGRVVFRMEGEGEEETDDANPVSEAVVLPVPGEVTWREVSFRAREVSGEDVEASLKRATREPRLAVLDPEEVVGQLTVGARREGETFEPLGMDGTMSLKDLFVNRKVPASLRDRWPVVRDQAGPVWIPGLHFSRRVRIRESSNPTVAIVLSVESLSEDLEETGNF